MKSVREELKAMGKMLGEMREEIMELQNLGRIRRAENDVLNGKIGDVDKFRRFVTLTEENFKEYAREWLEEELAKRPPCWYKPLISEPWFPGKVWWVTEPEKFRRKPNRIHGIFEDWVFDDYKIRSKDGRICLWIASGFPYFRDYRGETKTEPFLSGLTIFKKWLLWREYKRELRRRSMATREECLKNLKKFNTPQHTPAESYPYENYWLCPSCKRRVSVARNGETATCLNCSHWSDTTDFLVKVK